MLAMSGRLRKRPRQVRSRHTVDAILKGADRILRKDGYAAASTNRIARVAGFSVGSLYQYFDDKQAVVGALIDRFLREEAESLVPQVARLERERLESSAREMIARVAEARWANSHLLATLEQHETELCRGPALSYAVRIQAPLLQETLHRCGAPLYAEAAGDDLEERLFCLFRMLHSVSFANAVDAPAYVDGQQLAALLARLATQLTTASGAPSERSREIVASLVAGHRCSDAPAARRRRAAQEARTRLLREQVAGPGELEPRVLVAAALPEVAAQAARCAAVRLERVDVECARLMELLLTPAA
jgi:AcrR family transcriptional regulator